VGPLGAQDRAVTKLDDATERMLMANDDARGIRADGLARK
jgi:hypothetical protein